MCKAIECRALCQLTKTNLQCNDRAMARHIFIIKPEDVTTVRQRELLAKLEFGDLGIIWRDREKDCWLGYVERSSGAVRTACDIQGNGRHGPGRPKMIWKKVMENDCIDLTFTTVDPQKRSTWRSDLRSAMRAARNLPRRSAMRANRKENL